MIIIYICLGLLIGSLGIYFILKPKLQQVAQYNTEVEKKNKELDQQNADLKQEHSMMQTQILRDKQTYEYFQHETYKVQDNLKELQEKAKENADSYYKQALEIAQNSFDKEIENIAEGLSFARDEARQEYIKTLHEAVSDFEAAINSKREELDMLLDTFQDTAAKVDAAVEAAKRRQQMEEEQDFYRLQLSQEDIDEIAHLREVVPFLRDPEPLNKVIYKVYYEKPYVDLVGRVLGQNKIIGIYKITNLLDQKCYVGQSLNVSERWRQHIRRGVGAEAPTRNKLYPAMLATGVENFSFELIEECSADKLDEREKFWQSYFHAQDYGYSIK